MTWTDDETFTLGHVCANVKKLLYDNDDLILCFDHLKICIKYLCKI